MARKKKMEIVSEEKNEVAETKTIETEQNVENANRFVENELKEDIKKEKKVRFWDEVKSFFIIVLIIGVVILVGWLFIKYAKPIERNKKDDNAIISDNKDYNVFSYSKSEEDNYLEVVNNKYLIEYSEHFVIKIMDLKLNVLYEATDEEEYDFVEGINGKLYGITLGNSDDSLILNLYVLENEKMVEVKEFSKMGVYYVPLYTDNYLVGIVGNYCYLDGDLNNICESELFTLDEKTNILNDLVIEGDLSIGSDDESAPIYTRDSNYVVVKNENDGKYGLYDLNKGELIINTSYDDLYTTYNNSYVALKNGNVGIIDKKLKKLVDFNYELIDIQRDYYVVSKNGKLAIMNKDYELITGFDYEYDKDDNYYYRNSLLYPKLFDSIKLNDKYLLISSLYASSGYSYKAEHIYFIDSKGVSKKYDFDVFGVEEILYSYSFKTGELIIYDEDMNKKILIDLSDYDYNDYPIVELVNGNTIVVTLDSELYFDYSTGDELTEIQDVSYNIWDLELRYNNTDGKLYVFNDNKEILSYTYNPLYEKEPYIMVDDNSFYYLEDSNYIYIEKR